MIILSSYISSIKASAFNSKEYYLLSLYSTKNKQMAINVQESIINSGGAGYLYNYNKDICVLGFVYLNKDDANSVLNSNLSSYENSKIITLSADKINSKVQKQIKSDSYLLKAFKTICDLTAKLYDLSIEYDKGNVDVSRLYREIEILSINIDDAINKLENLKFEEKLLRSINTNLLLSLYVDYECLKSCKDEIYKGLKIERNLKLLCVKLCLEEVDLRKRLNSF